jgi:hypothetical protein
VSPLVWTHALAAVVALIIGIGLGWLLRGAVKEDIADSGKKVRWYRKLGVSEVLGITVTIVTIVALIGLMITVSQQRAVTECQRNFNELTREAVAERAKASDLDRQVLTANSTSTVTMLDVLLTPGTSTADLQAAIRTWRDAQNKISRQLAESAQIRQENPLPSATC